MNSNSFLNKSEPKYSIFKFIHFIFYLILIEVVLGGGGRFFQIGSLTLRMYLFFGSLFLSIFIIFLRTQFNKNLFYFLFFFTSLIIIGTLIGLVNNARTELLFEDIKPLSYFYAVIYFNIAITRFNQILIIKNAIKTLSVILALAYITLLFLLYFRIIGFENFVILVVSYGEVLFRGNEGLLFYKGFIYLNIGLLFFITDKSKYKLFFIILLSISIILTLTRGFILASFLSIIIYYLFFKNKLSKKIFILFFIGIGIIIILYYYQAIFGNRSESDSIRLLQIEQVFSGIDFLSFFIGHGFGIGVPIREIHMEIIFLEILHKQGIFGLLFWIILFFYIVYRYKKIKHENNKKTAAPFLLGTFLIYIQSFTNPYLNNPIGMSFALISLICIEKIQYFECIIPDDTKQSS